MANKTEYTYTIDIMADSQPRVVDRAQALVWIARNYRAPKRVLAEAEANAASRGKFEFRASMFSTLIVARAGQR